MRFVPPAVILAAGIGSRLQPITNDVPKCLLPIGPKQEKILDLMLEQLIALQVPEIYIVTGFQSEKIIDHLSSLWSAAPVRTIYNDDYATMNNARSLLSVRSKLDGQTFMKFDGDLVLQKTILPRLLGSEMPSAIILDRLKRPVDEDMKARIAADTGFVAAFGKQLPNNSDGISIGVELIGKEHSGAVFSAIDDCVYAQNRVDAYYEDAYQNIVGDGIEFGYVTTGGHAWYEIDESADYEQVCSIIGRKPSDFFAKY